jgi:hypothetical protein
MRDFVGINTPIGMKLDSIADNLYGDSDTTTPINDSLKGSLDAAAESIDKEGVADIKETMRSNGKDIASAGVFLTAADMNDKSFDTLNQFADASMSAMRDTIDGMADENGKLSAEDQKMVFEEYKNLLAGYGAYGEGAIEGINELYDTDTISVDKATEGLHKVMESETTPLFESIRIFEDKYCLSAEQKKELDAIEVPGMPKYSEYRTLEERAAAKEAGKESEKEAGKESDGTGKKDEGKGTSSAETGRNASNSSHVKKSGAKQSRYEETYNHFKDVVDADKKGMSGPVMERE